MRCFSFHLHFRNNLILIVGVGGICGSWRDLWELAGSMWVGGKIGITFCKSWQELWELAGVVGVSGICGGWRELWWLAGSVGVGGKIGFRVIFHHTQMQQKQQN